MASGTYITECETGQVKDEKSDEELKKKFQDSVDRLNLLIQNIDGQFEKVLSNHEQDFTAAYKVSYSLRIKHCIHFRSVC